MVEKITWSKEATKAFFDMCAYLFDTWTIRE